MATARKVVRARAPITTSHGRAYGDTPNGFTSPLTPAHIADLRTKGYTVVEGVLDAQSCATTKLAWLQTMEGYAGTGFKMNDRSTWTTANLPNSTRGMQDWPVRTGSFASHYLILNFV